MQIASCQRPIIAAILASALILISQASAATVSVDPAVSLTNYWSVEWNTNGNLEGWTISSATNASVTNGTLTGTASTTDPQIQWLNFASGPDLDLAFNDYLDLRIQVPASYAGNIQVFYGTTNTTGISGSRVLTIPNSSIPADGAFHTYRLDLALEQTWRGTLRDLRIDPVSVAGASFAIDFIRIGDLTGDLYYPNTTDQAVTTNELSSKHFRFIWDLNRATNSGMNATWAHGNLRNAEEVWAVYVKAFGYREPSESTDAARRDGRKFKVNFLCVNDGYWMSGSGTGYAYLNIDPSGLRVDPPTWVTPHEGMHVFQMHQGGSMPGEWWEGHANYGRERWIDFYDTLFAGQSGIDAAAIENGHMTIAIGRDYYLTWPLFLYLDENPDGLPDLGEGTVAKIWQTNAGGVYPYATIEQLTTNTSVKDVVGCFARRMLTLDFSHQTAITNALNTQNPAEWQRYQITELERRSDDTNWGRVPMEMAPQQGGYAIHELVPIGTNKVVSVNFRGLPDAARGADWRASFVALATNGVERYTPLWNAGTNTVTLASNESRLFLVVAATPDQFVYTGHDDLTYPYRSHPSKQRLHYEVQVFNATPKERDNGSTSGLVQHANGGGWKASTATVDSTAYLGPNARVLNTAKVRNNARVEDFAVVQNTAIVSNNAVISGHALVCDSAVVRDSAKVRDWAIAGGTVVISGNARVIEHARMLDGTVGDFATAKGSAWSQGGLALGGYGAIDGDFMGGRVVTNGFAYGHMPYVGVPDDWVRVVPDRLYAAYEFAAANDSMARDLYGATDAWLRGHPTWVGNDTRHFGVLSFDGAGDYVELDKSVGDWKDFTITAWAKWQGGAPNEPIVFLGSGTNKCLWLTPDDGAGHVKFTIRSNTLEQTLTAVAPAPVGVWTHLVVALSNNVGLLYVNGALAASGTVTLDPDQLFAGNSNAAPKTHFLARGADAAQPFFHGSLDSVRFYSKALSADEVAWLYAPAPNAGTVYVDLRATQPSAGTTNWLNLGTLGNFARVGSPSFVSNVASTGIPGVQFSGSGQAYQGPNSVPNLEGDSDRSIEVWAYNQSLASEETMVSWGHRGSTRQNMGFNFGNSTGWGAVTHYNDDVPWIAVPSSNAWHHLVYVYSNSIVKVYVDGVVNNTKTLGGALGTFTNEPINLACQRDSSNGTRSVYFSGYINSVRIHGGALTDDQVAANYLAGPAVPTPVINVAATQPVRVVDSRQFGINAAVWDSNFSATNTLALLREADCRILRFPGGSLADEYHWATGRSGTNTWNWATTFTEFAQAVTNLGAQAIVTVNYGSGTPEEAAAWVAHANVTNRYGFLYWEVGNEIYGTWETDTNSLPHDAYTYATRAAAYFTQMKATDPTIKIGIPVVPSETDYANGYTNHPVVNPRTGTTRTGWTPVVLTTLRSLGVRPDFVVYHRYAQSPGSENDAALLQSSKSWTNDAITLRQMVSDYLGTNSALTELFCTENNSVYSGPGKQTTSLVNGLFLADSFCQLMKTEFRALVWWDLRNGTDTNNNNASSLYGWRQYGDYGLLSSLTNIYPSYYAFKLLQHFARGGDQVFDVSSGDSLLSAYATRRANNSLALLVINKDPTNARPAQIALAGFAPQSNAVVHSYGIPQDEAAHYSSGSRDIGNTSLSDVDTNFSYTFPPYSITVFSLPPITNPPVLLVSTGAVWNYFDRTNDLGTAWRAPGYNDTTWSNGPAQLGFGDGDEATKISSNSLRITTYFRRAFSMATNAAFASLTARVLRDDGAVGYLNGVEIFRSNMPTNTAIGWATQAVASALTADETTNFYSYAVSPLLLVPGTNVLAVEVHQYSTTSTDLSFDLELSGITLTSDNNTPPQISTVSDQTTAEDTPILIPFTIGDAETRADALVVSAVSSNLALLPNANITISGSGSNRFLTLTPAPNQSGLALVSLTVSDPLTNTTTAFLLTVTPVADPPIVTLTAPTNSALLTSSVSFAATVSDPENDVALVEFFANGAKVAQGSSLPWTATWTNPPVGYYQVLAIATDATGLSATSSPAFVTVQWSLQTLASTGSVWKYSDQGLNLSNAWRAVAYDDSLWPSGPAPLGYGDANGTYPRTTNSFGTNSANKYITTYYRRAFVVPDAPAWSNATVTMQRDDGAVVYLNGTEIFRSNMTNAAIDYLTRALTTVSTTGETTWYSTNFNAALLRTGTNVLAVEIHQDKPDSSDIWLDLKLTAQPALAAPKLQAGAVSGGSALRWPAWAGGLRLSFATNLTATAVWQPETQPAVLVDGQWTLMVPPLGNTTRFYRLEYP